MPSNLSYSELFKYPWRVEKFLEKFRKEESFELVDGNVIQLLYSNQIEEWINNADRRNLMGKIFTTGNGSVVSLSDLRKTSEFGGKASDHGTRVESGEIISLNKQLQQIKSETLQMNINLKLHENVYSVSVCSKIEGTPKADFCLSDSFGNEVIWISHKKGNKVTHFQQWGGMTEEGIVNHSEVQRFTELIYSKHPDEFPKKTTYIRFINDDMLKNQSVYGIDYNKQPFGVQNVTAVIQGQILLTRSDNVYSLSAHHVYHNGQSINGEYEPVLSVRFTNDRNQFNIRNSRFSISPKEGRKYEVV